MGRHARFWSVAAAAVLWTSALFAAAVQHDDHAAAAAAGDGSAGGTGAGWIRFIQYLDEDTALQEVRGGGLDMYYSRIPPDRVGDARSREGLQVYESTGGSYSILANPAEYRDGGINPFASRDARFALNYLVDRNLVVNEIMGGYGVPMASNYGPFDPEYLAVVDLLEGFAFRYNPGLADSLISGAMEEAGARKADGGWWVHGDDPVVVTVFIRSDDPVRRSVGEVLASELEALGFEVARDYGDLNKAFVVVYGSDPADGEWSLYTEGWAGRSALVRYDPVGLAQMYAPWFSGMPGFNNPGYWNYENGRLDEVTQRIYTGNFTSAAHRNELVREATAEGVGEAVRVFLAGKIDLYAVGGDVTGVVNDFGAGIPTRFTAINARGAGDGLTVGVKQIYQGAWNPVRGLTDVYSTHVWNPVSDPAVFRHPHTGKVMPVRAQWDIQTAGPGERIEVPPGAVLWDPAGQRWTDAGGGATSKVTFDLEFGNWHNGEPMDMSDVMYAVYFASEWGSAHDGDGGGGSDRTFDSEYTPQAAQVVSALAGVRQTGPSQIEVYVDYWHFDQDEIADWASAWSVMPWEVYAAMERVVLDGGASFSRSGAAGKNVGWLSLVVPGDAALIREALEGFRRDGFVPAALGGSGHGQGYFDGRYSSTIGWIDGKNHAVISNGPFYLESYAPESRTMMLRSFDDPTYPIEAGRWSEFEHVKPPRITGADANRVVPSGGDAVITVNAENADEIRYFASSGGEVIDSGTAGIGGDGGAVIRVGADVLPGVGTVDVRIFAVSDDIVRPDLYSTSMVVAGGAGGDAVQGQSGTESHVAGATGKSPGAGEDSEAAEEAAAGGTGAGTAVIASMAAVAAAAAAGLAIRARARGAGSRGQAVLGGNSLDVVPGARP